MLLKKFWIVPVLLLLRLLGPAWQAVDWARYMRWLFNTLSIGVAAAVPGQQPSTVGAPRKGPPGLTVHSCAPVAVAAAHGLHVSRADGTPLIYNQADTYMPDLLICRPEWAEQVLAEVAALAVATAYLT